MIIVDVAEQGPRLLNPSGPLVVDALAALEQFYDRTAHAKKQQRPPLEPTIYAHASVRAALREAFHDKCAYCESPHTTAAPLDVEHFRPVAGALDSDGTENREHYWWLTYSWENLLLACSDCVRAKGHRFPVIGPRAGRGSLDETYVLLDPRRGASSSDTDSPSLHLVFLADGLVVSSTDRGTATIDVLALNRATLVAGRRDLAGQIQAVLHAGRGTSEWDDLVRGLLDPSQPFLAMRQQLIAVELREPSLTDAPIKRHDRQRTKAAYQSSQAIKESYTLADGPDDLGDAARASYFGATRWIERVVIKNFRPIHDLDIDMSASSSTSSPWTVLLGDNGAGKSSVLQAIALTLIGAAYRDDLGITSASLLRHGARVGRIDVHLSGLATPLSLRFNSKSDELIGTEAPQVLLLGYGSTRLLPRGREAARSPASPTVRVDNLFDPFRPITDPTAWLLSLDEDLFDDVAAALKLLLALEDNTRFDRDPATGMVSVRQGRRRDPIDELSDGYQSMLVLACDVMKTVMSLWSTPTQAEGIVLIDELGAHLHPRWRMRIVPALRAILPRVQFVMTTHDPLCLRGLEDGEVVVMRRNDDGRVVTITDLPPVRGLRVEQLLTSEHFGLGSTEDPEIDDLFREYYTLRAKRRPTAADRRRITELEQRLGELRQLGTTERERLLLHSVDGFIAERRAQGDGPATTATTAKPATPASTPAAPASVAVTQRVDEELLAIWNEVLPTAAVAGRE